MDTIWVTTPVVSVLSTVRDSSQKMIGVSNLANLILQLGLHTPAILASELVRISAVIEDAARGD